jgi:flagellar motor switch protein FliN/FliY
VFREGERMDAQEAQGSDRRRKPITSRLMKLPVPVAVHLAERKIDMSQLLSMAPGTLLTFEKSCEDLLDLYVNNRIYAKGEAVKIGEKFGLKINQLGELSSDA